MCLLVVVMLVYCDFYCVVIFASMSNDDVLGVDCRDLM
jgi:hypothetical protein